MVDEYKALCKLEYSKDVWFRGCNIKLRKAGKGLCVIYPKEHYFNILVVVGDKGKERVEELLPTLSKRNAGHHTLKLIRIRRGKSLKFHIGAY